MGGGRSYEWAANSVGTRRRTNQKRAGCPGPQTAGLEWAPLKETLEKESDSNRSLFAKSLNQFFLLTEFMGTPNVIEFLFTFCNNLPYIPTRYKCQVLIFKLELLCCDGRKLLLNLVFGDSIQSNSSIQNFPRSNLDAFPNPKVFPNLI